MPRFTTTIEDYLDVKPLTDWHGRFQTPMPYEQRYPLMHSCRYAKNWDTPAGSQVYIPSAPRHSFLSVDRMHNTFK